jgi:hypothetical protein
VELQKFQPVWWYELGFLKSVSTSKNVQNLIQFRSLNSVRNLIRFPPLESVHTLRYQFFLDKMPIFIISQKIYENAWNLDFRGGPNPKAINEQDRPTSWKVVKTWYVHNYNAEN